MQKKEMELSFIGMCDLVSRKHVSLSLCERNVPALNLGVPFWSCRLVTNVTKRSAKLTALFLKKIALLKCHVEANCFVNAKAQGKRNGCRF